MKTEHKQLKAICDVIGYEADIWAGGDYNCFIDTDYLDENKDWKTRNVREIIFTTEFIDKYRKYFLEKSSFSYMKNERKENIFDIIISEMMQYELNNPVQHLHNTLNLGN